MAVATLRIIKPSIANSRLSSEYSRTFVCKDYPSIGISSNTISTFLQRLGQDGKKHRLFYQKRAMKVAENHHVAIDGMLKQDTSIVNDLSAFSYKARVKGCKDVSVIYAFDIEAMEPLCAEVFPGNSIDAVSYRSFILDNNIRNDINIADKGFPPVRSIQELVDLPDLHFLTPITEFINFIATVATYRMIAKAREAGLLNKMSYKDLMDNLSASWRMVDSPEKPRTDDGCWVHTITNLFEELEALGLSIPVLGPEPKKRGWPKKEPQEQKSKRPRGSPRKIPDLPSLYSMADWETCN